MRFPRTSFGVAAAILLAVGSLPAQIIISGNENKIDLTSGVPTVVQNAGPDSISILDFSKFPPKVTHIMDVPNTVIGPPSNIAFTPDGSTAWISSSVKIDPNDPSKFVPDTLLQKIELDGAKPEANGFLRFENGVQTSGMSFSPKGGLLIGANRAAGSVAVFELTPTRQATLPFVEVCEPGDNPSDVAISPDGKTALVSIQNKSVLVELKIDGKNVSVTGRKFSVYGKPYRVVITPDGDLAITAGGGFGGPTDLDAVSIVDLKANPPHTVQHVTTGASPESLEISPDGQLLVVDTMSGSNLAANDPAHRDAGGLYLYHRNGNRFELSQELKTGRIPQGVAFTSDGKYLLVQCHADREIRIYEVTDGKVKDTGERVKVPGHPSSIRAAR